MKIFSGWRKDRNNFSKIASENLLLVVEANVRDHSIRNISNISIILSLYTIYYLKMTIFNN